MPSASPPPHDSLLVEWQEEEFLSLPWPVHIIRGKEWFVLFYHSISFQSLTIHHKNPLTCVVKTRQAGRTITGQTTTLLGSSCCGVADLAQEMTMIVVVQHGSIYIWQCFSPCTLFFFCNRGVVIVLSLWCWSFQVQRSTIWHPRHFSDLERDLD